MWLLKYKPNKINPPDRFAPAGFFVGYKGKGETLKIFLIFVIGLLTSSCVIFPTSHVVFEPISSEGKLIDPEPCGYMFSNNVLLVIKTPAYNFETMAFADAPDKKLKVYFRIIPLTDSISVDFNSISVVLKDRDGEEMKPVSVEQRAYGSSTKFVNSVTEVETLLRETNNFYYMEFPVLQESVEEFDLVFGKHAVSIGGKQLNMNPVKFKKAKKSDLYFGSINC